MFTQRWIEPINQTNRDKKAEAFAKPPSFRWPLCIGEALSTKPGERNSSCCRMVKCWISLLLASLHPDRHLWRIKKKWLVEFEITKVSLSVSQHQAPMFQWASAMDLSSPHLCLTWSLGDELKRNANCEGVRKPCINGWSKKGGFKKETCKRAWWVKYLNYQAMKHMTKVGASSWCDVMPDHSWRDTESRIQQNSSFGTVAFNPSLFQTSSTSESIHSEKHSTGDGCEKLRRWRTSNAAWKP